MRWSKYVGLGRSDNVLEMSVSAVQSCVAMPPGATTVGFGERYAIAVPVAYAIAMPVALGGARSVARSLMRAGPAVGANI